MKVPMWIRVSAVTFSTFLAGMYVTYATGFGGFVGDIFPHPYQTPDPRSFDPPRDAGSHTRFIPSSKWGEVFTPPLPTPDDFDRHTGQIDTESPTYIPHSGLPELGLFGPEPTPVIVVPPDLPQIDLNERQFIPSTKSFSPRHIQPPQPKETK